MQRTELSNDQYARLLKAILNIVLDKGPSHTTMDYVASRLGMSKRTLYEIFGSKDEMLREVLEYQHNVGHQETEEIFRTTENMMEAMIKVIALHQRVLEKTSSAFFRDMDERCKQLRPDYDSKNDEMNRHLNRIIALGIRQGMFRKNCDFEIQLRLLRIQIESIKRMEDFFPPEITIGQAYKAIGQAFLRSIATQEGIAFLDKLES